MAADTITLEVDADTARAYMAASDDEKKNLQLLLCLRLQELTAAPPASLRSVMDTLSDQAEARGLTPSLLETLLRDA